MNYQQAQGLLASARSRAAGKPLCNNTRLFERENGFAIKYHATDVVLIHPDNTYTLNSGGWRTPTTKDRIDSYSPARIYQDKGIWYVLGGVLFEDGIKIGFDGHVISGAGDPAYIKAYEAVNKMILTYIRGFVKHVKENGIESPGSGDCWGCCMTGDDVEKGLAMGASHHFDHFEEPYYVPSLLYNGLVLRNGGNDERAQMQYGIIMNSFGFDFMAKSALQAYFRRHKEALVRHYMGEPARIAA